MSKHLVLPTRLPMLPRERWANNGRSPSAGMFSSIAHHLNQVSGRQKKQFLTAIQPLNAVSAGSSAAVIVWPTRFITGENCTSIRVSAGIALTDYGAVSTPMLTILVKSTAGATVATKDVAYHGKTTGTTVAPDEINHGSVIIDGLTANTEYYLENQVVNGMRLVYMVAVELALYYADDTVTAVCNPVNFMAEGPIYNTQINDVADAANKLWRHNGKHLFTFTQPYDESSAATSTSTTYTNVIDGSSTTVTAASPGFSLYTTYDGTYARANAIPVKMAIYTQRTSGSGTLSVRINDGTSTIAITGITSTQQWSTVTSTIAAQAGTKWDIQAANSAGASSWRIYAVSLFEYEA